MFQIIGAEGILPHSKRIESLVKIIQDLDLMQEAYRRSGVVINDIGENDTIDKFCDLKRTLLTQIIEEQECYASMLEHSGVKTNKTEQK